MTEALEGLAANKAELDELLADWRAFKDRLNPIKIIRRALRARAQGKD